ncbi:hypothetical protein ETD86_12980 [Nonomuraea turkmeniaca]|uniref:Uncharacterized protein n=1 Tax=Nonomuraea turkmeniaca TaxID=103838 RepID=A0A5S4FMX2_9ACTN|nr:hypothetical protein [Nonomuraea turkmeniaca]TMR22076.1 hypothetical protein ETD86_12980 [Nonomuraea turkmeniaca]
MSTGPSATVQPPAAPLTPPAPPAQTQADVEAADADGEPGPPALEADFVDLLWADAEAGEELPQADPDGLFNDPGDQFGFVLVARPLVARRLLPGTTDRTSDHLMAQKGRRMNKNAAWRLQETLRAVRARRQAT